MEATREPNNFYTGLLRPHYILRIPAQPLYDFSLVSCRNMTKKSHDGHSKCKHARHRWQPEKHAWNYCGIQKSYGTSSKPNPGISVYSALPYTAFAKWTALFVAFVMSLLKIPVDKIQQNIHVEKSFQWNIIYFSEIQVELCFYYAMTQINMLRRFT